MLVAISLVGCGNASQSSPASAEGDFAQGESAEPKKDAIQIDEIAWVVEAGVDDGDRRVMFSYANNSDYAIAEVRLEMTMKEDAESELIQSAFDYILDQGLTEDDIRDKMFVAESEERVEPGESSSSDTCNFAGYYANNIEQYDLMEPDVMTIKFLHNDMLYEEYYDFKSQSYSLSSNVVDIKQWSDSELSALLPVPENEIVVDLSESSTRFSFSTIATSTEGFDAYVEKCRENGFTADVTWDDTFYYSKSEDGAYKLDILLTGSSMSAYLSPVS